jgi:hypothetical protein
MAEVRIEGAKRFRSDLKRAGADLKAMNEAHAKVSAYVAGKAAPDAPVLTGRLRSSLRSSGQRGAAIVRLGSASLPYAGPIHYGWAARNIEPNPFVTETIDDEQAAWLHIYDDAVQAILDQVRGV